MEHILWTGDDDDRGELPELHNPALLLAFEGWNDAGEAATTAVAHICDSIGSTELANIDPEPFYDFSNTRPQVRLSEGKRRIEWPRNTFYSGETKEVHRDLIVLNGTEPQLRWRTYTEQIIAIVEEFDVELVVSVGALVAEVVHSRPASVYSAGYDQNLIKSLDLETSNYEGPTGIVGVVHDALTNIGIGSVSLWATVPGYVPHLPSPKASLALVNRLNQLLNLAVPTADLELETLSYEEQITELVQQDSEISDYVARLEERYDSSMNPESGDQLIVELEKFLKDRD